LPCIPAWDSSLHSKSRKYTLSLALAKLYRARQALRFAQAVAARQHRADQGWIFVSQVGEESQGGR